MRYIESVVCLVAFRFEKRSYQIGNDSFFIYLPSQWKLLFCYLCHERVLNSGTVMNEHANVNENTEICVKCNNSEERRQQL